MLNVTAFIKGVAVTAEHSALTNDFGVWQTEYLNFMSSQPNAPADIRPFGQSGGLLSDEQLGAVLGYLINPDQTIYGADLPVNFNFFNPIPTSADQFTLMLETLLVTACRKTDTDLWNVRLADLDTGSHFDTEMTAEQFAASVALAIGGENGAHFDEPAHAIADPIFDHITTHFGLEFRMIP